MNHPKTSPSPPASTGILRALWTLTRPPTFTPRAPHAAAEPFHPARARGIPRLADVYLPETPGPHPSVILVHGGAFVVGSRRMNAVRYLATRLAEAGIASAAIDYRMIFRGGRLDEARADVDAAAHWWLGAHERFGLDPARVSIAGFSAGATLALLEAAAAPDRYHRVVSFFGVYDFTWLGGRLATWMRRLLLRSGDPAVWATHSPIVRSDMPAPLLLVHGTADTMVPIEHARRLHATRTAKGLPVQLLEFPGIPHGFLNDATLPETRAAADAVVHFLRSPDPNPPTGRADQ